MLGLVHRILLGEGPPHFKKWFYREDKARPYSTRLAEKTHHRQLHNYVDGEHTELLKRSALGLPRVYNRLPAEVVECRSVKDFQAALQKLVEKEAKTGRENWSKTLSPRT